MVEVVRAGSVSVKYVAIAAVLIALIFRLPFILRAVRQFLEARQGRRRLSQDSDSASGDSLR